MKKIKGKIMRNIILILCLNAFYMLQKEWVERAVMKTAGVITMFFGIWTVV